MARLLRSPDTDRDLLLAAVQVSVGVRGKATVEHLDELSESEDRDVAEMARRAMGTANALHGDLSDW